MEKILRWFEDLWHCTSWIFVAIFENCVDLKFWKFPTNPNDLLWYAERVNGRVAMITLVIVLHLELFYHASIWQLTGIQH